jgi:iron complex transport system ATP-binding protein
MIEISHLNYSYNGKPVLNNIDIAIQQGEFVGIIGPNGAGKSTLLKLMDRVLKIQTGAIRILDKEINQYTQKELAKVIGFVQQEFKTGFNFNVMDIVLMGRHPHQKMFFVDTQNDLDIASTAMNATDCQHLRERLVNTLSGGERQRVILASALAQEPKILLLDEPTTALDLKHQVHFYDIVEKLRRAKGLTVISVTHDLNLILKFCTRILVLKSGKILADGTIDDIVKKDILENAYDTSIEIIAHPQSGIPIILTKYQT